MCDLAHRATSGVEPQCLVDELPGVHAVIMAVTTDNSGALGGIRTHTAWILNPSSLPLDYEGGRLVALSEVTPRGITSEPPA